MQSVLGFTAVDDAAAKMTVRLAETIEIEEKYFHSRNGRSGKFVKCVATAIDRAAEGPVSFVVEPSEYPSRPLYIATKSIKAAVWDVCCEEYYTSHPEARAAAGKARQALEAADAAAATATAIVSAEQGDDNASPPFSFTCLPLHLQMFR
jgi:hypothetical protein